MLLVPRQLRRVGMTGNVPYYGGRLTPAQAYAASHPARAVAPPPAPPASGYPRATRDALDQLHDDGVVSDEEYGRLKARMDT
jgi:hypothetical protein